MAKRSTIQTRPFLWSVFRGRCRRRVVVGLLVLCGAAAYGTFAGQRFGTRGYDERDFDQPLVRLADSLTPQPVHLGSVRPENDRELYLVTVISDQQDILFGLTLLVLRMIATLTIGGFGLVLLTAGSTEWEVRSERQVAP